MTSKTSILVLITLFSLSFFSGTVMSEIYTWVDENGKKHFGDRIPDEYRTKSNSVDLKNANTIPSRKIDYPAPSVSKKSKAKNSNKKNKVVVKKKVPSKAKNRDMECKEQFAKYKKSIRCFSACRNAGGGINLAKCPKCTNVPRPRCSQVY